MVQVEPTSPRVDLSEPDGRDGRTQAGGITFVYDDFTVAALGTEIRLRYIDRVGLTISTSEEVLAYGVKVVQGPNRL